MIFGRIVLIGLIVVFLASCSSRTEGDKDFEYYTMAKAQKLAESNDKKIIVDVYTDWCTFCKKLENEVYPDDRIGQVVNEYFYVVRVNAESEEELVYNGRKIKMREFAELLGVSTYPSTVFIDKKGTTIGQQSGFMEVEVFEKLLAFVGSSAYRTMQFDEFSVNSLPFRSSQRNQAAATGN
jgi:thioredoxin-related protein